ncbi:hypothetical protein HYT24_00335 [Candidatus Pacearchaeota archaeon]|nr:hypothetical protein [Candidatus Pacearchaeota archaeon]
MKNPIKLKKATLFDCNIAKDGDQKEINVADLVGKKVFILDPISKNLEFFKSTIESNIMKKLDALESDNLAKKETKVSPLADLMPLPTSRGPKQTGVNFDVNDNTLLEEILKSSSSDDFKQKTIKLANKYVDKTNNPKGALGFVIFDIEINRRTETFLAILIADYRGTLSPDESNAVKFLDKVFDKDFRDIIFYPRLISATDTGIRVSRNEVKSCYKVKSNPDLLHVLNINPKVHPNDKLKKAYKDKLGKPASMRDLVSDLGSDAKNAEIVISIDGKTVNIPFLDFLKKFKLIYSEKGEGIFVEGGLVKVIIGGKEIRRDWWIKHSFNIGETKG